MPTSTEKYSLIAKNTMLLYVRTFITMLVGLYTSRVLLEALGIDNYGIFNVVGGIVAFSSIITGSMANACSRYTAYALGQSDMQQLKTVFCTSANVQIIMGLIAALILEIGGIWFINTVANIPPDRLHAANWVLQCTIITTFISLSIVPYHALIIAHERMSVYAWMSIIDVTAKLLICFALLHFGGDRLILYAWLLVGVTLFVAILYVIYCRRNFAAAKYERKINKPLLKDMVQFSGWNLLNNSAWVSCSSGVNMLVNVYFGVAYNAARGVAATVNGCVQAFIGNFTTAFNPQIVKSYAANDMAYCFALANRGMKFTWLLMLIFIVPVSIEADKLLHLWLTEVPPLASLFLIFSMFESLAVQSGSTFLALIQATGKMKRYSILTTLYVGLIFPITWIAFHFGAPVWISYPVFIFIFFTLNVVRLSELKRLMQYSWKTWLKDVLRPCLTVTALSFVLPIVIAHFWQDSLLRFIVLVPISALYTAGIIYALGLTSPERDFVMTKIRNILHRI